MSKTPSLLEIEEMRVQINDRRARCHRLLYVSMGIIIGGGLILMASGAGGHL